MVKIKTSFWEKTNWQPKVEKLIYIYGIITAINILMSTNIITTILNTLIFIFTTTIIISHNKWRKTKWKQKQNNQKQSKSYSNKQKT